MKLWWMYWWLTLLLLWWVMCWTGDDYMGGRCLEECTTCVSVVVVKARDAPEAS